MTGQPLIRVSRWDPSDRKQAILDFWKDLAAAVVRAVENSFKVAKMRSPTMAEMTRRTHMAKSLAEEMRDLGWGKVRIKDTLGLALSARLVGLQFDLEAVGARSMW